MRRQNYAEQMFPPLESVLAEQNLAAGLGLEIRIRDKICSPVQNRSPAGNRAFLSRTRQLMPIRRVHKLVQMLMLLNHSESFHTSWREVFNTLPCLEQ